MDLEAGTGADAKKSYAQDSLQGAVIVPDLAVKQPLPGRGAQGLDLVSPGGSAFWALCRAPGCLANSPEGVRQ